jgi:hypothetical protein
MPKQPRNHRETWTTAANQQLRQLARQNTPTRVMGLKLGRTEDAVRIQAARIRQSLKPTNQSPYGTREKRRKS